MRRRPRGKKSTVPTAGITEEAFAYTPMPLNSGESMRAKDSFKNNNDMTLHEYQEQAMKTCMKSSRNFSYMMLNLVGEVGELSSKVAKAIRKEEAAIDYRGDLRHPSTRRIDDELEEAMQKEAGDVLWQIAGLCHVMGWSLEAIAQQNLDKLASRQQRGVIEGNGDNR